MRKEGNTQTAGERGESKNGKAHDIEVASLDAVDENRSESLDRIGTGLVVIFAGSQVPVYLRAQQPAHVNAGPAAG